MSLYLAGCLSDMTQYISYETGVFLTSVRLGVIILVLYDMLRIFRRVKSRGTISVAAEDLIFSICMGVYTFYTIFICNSGVIRGYIIMGIAIGMYIYHFSISNMLVTYVSRFLIYIIKMIIIPLRIILIPLKKAIWFINKYLKKTIEILKKSIKTITIKERKKKESGDDNDKKKKEKE